jgi:putative ABC transport system substrate-binding protein
MRRRDLILGLGATLASPLVARAQGNPPVVAILDAKGTNPLLDEQCRKGLAETGYRDGENVTVRYRSVDGHYDRFPAAAAELVRDRADVIIALSVPGAIAAKAATSSTPIVFMSGFDPVKVGLVASLNKPGGNVTGVSMLTVGLNAKRLQMMREMVPSAQRIALLFNPGQANVTALLDETQAAANSLGCELAELQARTEGEIDTAFADMAAQKIGALVVANDPFLTGKAHQIVALAARNRLPGIYEWRDFVEAGGLASYGSDRADDYRMLGVYAGKILAGAKPADLPVTQPTKFELVINLKTAKALGLTIPPILLGQADEVIE